MSDRKYQDGDYNLRDNQDPVCPYCGRNNIKELYERGISFEDGDESEIRCEHCAKEFKVQTFFVVRFASYVKDIDGLED